MTHFWPIRCVSLLGVSGKKSLAFEEAHEEEMAFLSPGGDSICMECPVLGQTCRQQERNRPGNAEDGSIERWKKLAHRRSLN